MKSLITLIIVALSYPTLAQWTVLGSAGFSTGTPQYLQMAMSGETPYVAYKDASNSERCTVMKFNGSTWETVGSAGFTPGIARDLDIIIVDGTPYVCFADAENLHRPTVYKFDGSDWVQVGGVVSSSSTYGTSINYHDSVFYVGSVQGNAGYGYKFVDSVWSQVTFVPASMGSVQDMDMAIDPSSGKVYMSYRDNVNDGKASVATPGMNSWLNVGPLGFTTNAVRSTKLAIKDGVPYVAFRDVVTDRISVMKNDGGWSMVGQGSFSDGSIISPAIGFLKANHMWHSAMRWIRISAQLCIIMELNGKPFLLERQKVRPQGRS
ncbi:MAG TPA: hypothetical protein DCX14_02365 [Flavobacteriales bacterium]|nr:hypothetical protein [Flavobacteriales bacterium]